MKRKDIVLFGTVLFLIVFYTYSMVFEPNLRKQKRTDELTQVATRMALGIDFLTVIDDVEYDDSFRFIYDVDSDYLERNGSDVLRRQLDESLSKSTCDILSKIGLESDFTINVVAGPNGGPMYDKYFTSKNCS